MLDFQKSANTVSEIIHPIVRHSPRALLCIVSRANFGEFWQLELALATPSSFLAGHMEIPIVTLYLADFTWSTDELKFES